MRYSREMAIEKLCAAIHQMDDALVVSVVSSDAAIVLRSRANDLVQALRCASAVPLDMCSAGRPLEDLSDDEGRAVGPVLEAFEVVRRLVRLEQVEK